MPAACTRLPMSIILRGPKRSTRLPMTKAPGIVSSADSDIAEPICTSDRSVIARK